MTIVVITWPVEFDRSPEVFGQEGWTEADANDWLDTLVTEGTILDEATFLITKLGQPFDWSDLSRDAMHSPLPQVVEQGLPGAPQVW